MRSDHELELLEPPPGGAERFRQRLAASASAAPRYGPMTAGLAALALLVALFYFGPLRERTEPPATASSIIDAPEFDRLLGRESQPLPLLVERNDEPLTVAELRSTDPKVRIYELP
jgi:hypothetical protein